MIRGRRAHGAALATLATCAHLSPDNQARLHNAISARFHCFEARGSRPLNPPKPLNECLRHTVPYCATPKGLANTRGRCPHPRSPRGRGAGKTSCTLTTERLGRLQPVKAKPQAVASQALTGFQLHPLRIVLLLTEVERGQGRRSRAFYP